MLHPSPRASSHKDASRRRYGRIPKARCGVVFLPLYRSVPEAALKDEGLYRFARAHRPDPGGSARERAWAEKELAKALESGE